MQGSNWPLLPLTDNEHRYIHVSGFIFLKFSSYFSFRNLTFDSSSSDAHFFCKKLNPDNYTLLSMKSMSSLLRNALGTSFLNGFKNTEVISDHCSDRVQPLVNVFLYNQVCRNRGHHCGHKVCFLVSLKMTQKITINATTKMGSKIKRKVNLAGLCLPFSCFAWFSFIWQLYMFQANYLT